MGEAILGIKPNKRRAILWLSKEGRPVLISSLPALELLWV